MQTGVASLIALLTGLAGIIAAAGGVLLAIRAVRTRERKAAKEELDQVTTMLSQERGLRVQSERYSYHLMLTLAEHGIEAPPIETSAIEASATEAPVESDRPGGEGVP
jgi:hypothetical protein